VFFIELKETSSPLSLTKIKTIIIKYDYFIPESVKVRYAILRISILEHNIILFSLMTLFEALTYSMFDS
jgi:hypothetical protein